MILTGEALYASFFPHEILAGGLHRVAFWVGVIVGLVGQVSFAFLAERAAKASENKLDEAGETLNGLETRLAQQVEQLSKIPTIVRTQPPETFLVKYGAAIESNILIAMKVLESPGAVPREAVENTLGWLASLASVFDASDSGAASGQFSANLMVFVPMDALGPWASRIRFADGADQRRYTGALVLRADLCRDQNGNRGALPEEFGLFVPRTPFVEMPASAPDGGKRRWTALPGAPLAFAQRGLEMIPDVKKLGEWTRDYTDFAPSIAADVENYFKTIHTQISGFLSMPVVIPSTDPNQPGRVVGVVNIDWTRSRLLMLPEGASTFHHQVQPVLSLLALLVEKAGTALTTVPTPHA